MSPRRSVYDGIADDYAATVDSKPQNALYERPAMMALLPPVTGRRVLDVGCGSGWYAEQLVEQGAMVTAVDVEPRFVELTRRRLGERAQVLRADLVEPLEFAANGVFDLILCPLVLHYLPDWGRLFAEFARVLAPGGRLLFSTHHPFMDWQTFETGDYFRTELLEDDWAIGKVTFYRRPLTAMCADLAAAGFVIERIVEPQPDERYREANREWYERLMKNPWFLLVRARLG